MAKIALQKTGFLPLPVGKGSLGQPLWPPGVIASLAHDHTHAGCLIAKRNSNLIGIGLDFEPIDRHLDHKLHRTLFTSTEVSRLAKGQHWAPLAGFCIKEAVFKCLNPLTKVYFGFHDIELETITASNFTIRCSIFPSAGQIRVNPCIQGHIWVSENKIFTAVMLDGNGQWLMT